MNYRQPLGVFLIAGTLGLSHGAFAGGEEDGTSTVEALKRDGQALLQSMEEYTAEQKTKAVEAVDESLDRLDARIETLEARLSENWNAMSEDARTKLSGQLNKLREQRIEVAEWYGSLKQNTGVAWNDLKAGFSESFEDLSEAWQDAENSFNDQG